MSFHYDTPVDPNCEQVQDYHAAVLEDPLTHHYGMGGEVLEHWDREHRAECKRCQEYGAANIEVR